MQPVRLGLCFNPELLRSRRNVRRFASIDILMFPELADGGYSALRRGALPHRPRDPYLSGFQAASKIFRLCCIAGSTMYRDARPHATNTSLVFHHGRLLHRYDKMHLFRPTGDHRYFVAGSRAPTFRIRLNRTTIRAGVVICYDLRFPELIRSMALDGIQVLFVPARWPAVRDDAWRTLLKARAIENQMFVVGCNARGPEGGSSYAFDPSGAQVHATPKNSTAPLEVFALDLRRLRTAKRLHDNLRDAVLLRKGTAGPGRAARRTRRR